MSLNMCTRLPGSKREGVDYVDATSQPRSLGMKLPLCCCLSQPLCLTIAYLPDFWGITAGGKGPLLKVCLSEWVKVQSLEGEWNGYICPSLHCHDEDQQWRSFRK